MFEKVVPVLIVCPVCGSIDNTHYGLCIHCGAELEESIKEESTE